MYRRFLSTLICLAVISNTLPVAQAQPFTVNDLPRPGSMVDLSQAFSPLVLKGLLVNSNDPLDLQFIVDTGQRPKNNMAIRQEATDLAKFFLAGLTIPEGDWWVNLSPYEKNRIIPSSLGTTRLGRDLLAEDYVLKQLTASLIYPEKDLGRQFWARIYTQARQKFGTTQIPVNTFNKVWVLPDQSQVFENARGVYITKSTLKVMLEEDYMALQKNGASRAAAGRASPSSHSMASRIVRELVLPEIAHEVNTGRNFARLRQIYTAMILAKWYKETIENGLLDAVYTDKKKIAGINVSDPSIKQKIYQRYLQAYKKGVFNYIKELPSPDGQPVPRKYFSGGLVWNMNLETTTNEAMLSKSLAKTAGALVLLAFNLNPVHMLAPQRDLSPIYQELGLAPSLPPEAWRMDLKGYEGQELAHWILRHPMLTAPLTGGQKEALQDAAMVSEFSIGLYLGLGYSFIGLMTYLFKGSEVLKAYLAWPIILGFVPDLVSIFQDHQELIYGTVSSYPYYSAGFVVGLAPFSVLAGRKYLFRSLPTSFLKWLLPQYKETESYDADLVSDELRKREQVQAEKKILSWKKTGNLDQLIEMANHGDADIRMAARHALEELASTPQKKLQISVQMVHYSQWDRNIKWALEMLVQSHTEQAIRIIAARLGGDLEKGWSLQDYNKALQELNADEETIIQANVSALSKVEGSPEKYNYISNFLWEKGRQEGQYVYVDHGKHVYVPERTVQVGQPYVVDISYGVTYDEETIPAHNEWKSEWRKVLRMDQYVGQRENALKMAVRQRLVSRQPPDGRESLLTFEEEAFQYALEGYDFKVFFDQEERRFGQVYRPEILRIERGEKLSDQAMTGLKAQTPGGIDLNHITVQRTGHVIKMQFDPAQLQALQQGGFAGFTPVITNLQRISNPFQLLGIHMPEKPMVLAKA